MDKKDDLRERALAWARRRGVHPKYQARRAAIVTALLESAGLEAAAKRLQVTRGGLRRAALRDPKLRPLLDACEARRFVDWQLENAAAAEPLR